MTTLYIERILCTRGISRSPLPTNRWKLSDSTLRTLRTEVSNDYPESSDEVRII